MNNQLRKMVETYAGSALYEAYLPAGIAEHGMGTALLARRTTGGAIVGTGFLCDHWCLGVKDCFAFYDSVAGYAQVYNRVAGNEELIRVTPETLKAYISGLVAWARAVGFPPHSDYRICGQLLQGITPDPEAHFTYGHNGVPSYVSGPHDSALRIREVAYTLGVWQERTGVKPEITIHLGPGLDLEDIGVVEPDDELIDAEEAERG